ncbi:NUDIX hydrolase [Flexivirga sp.]|uniref:NUDIX hydrolase n=1 Tax=Flexivirga sp. TaxID=1962927 RepID=UPI003F7FF767
MPAAEIVVSAVVFRDPQGRVLTVRKSGTDKFMFPGGKLEPRERPIDAAVREVAEELDIQVRAADLRLLGTFTADAANEPGHTVTATVYEHDFVPVSAPAAEIAELRWADVSADATQDLAPLLAHRVFPALRGGHLRPSVDRPLRERLTHETPRPG